MKKRKSLVVLVMISLAINILIVGCGKDSGSGENVLSKMFTVKGDDISLNKIEFLMSKEDVIEKKQLKKDDLETNTEEQIVKNTSVEGITENAKEIYKFQDQKLVSTDMIMLIEKDKYSDACNKIYQQVKKVMPATDLSDIEAIKDGKEMVMWQGDGIKVNISFPESGESDGGKMIVISAGYAK